MTTRSKHQTVDEIAVTPEMIEVGVRKLVSYDIESSSEEDVVYGIFKEMYKLHRVKAAVAKSDAVVIKLR